MNYRQLAAACVTAIKARDIGTAFARWEDMKTAADKPSGSPGSFVDWLIDNGAYDIAGANTRG